MRAPTPSTFMLTLAACCAAAAPTTARAQAPAERPTGGAGYGAPADPRARLTVPGAVARLGRDGLARAPELAPPAVKEAIWAANEIQDKPYVYGGGHGRTLRARGYDCSGTVSYALRGAGLLKAPRDSSGFMRWGAAGEGRWVTVYTNPGHAFMVIAGLRLDTSAAGDRSRARGPRWRPALRSTRGYRVRHPAGY
jgi:cell wall-associated NlpC family hydrolase